MGDEKGGDLPVPHEGMTPEEKADLLEKYLEQEKRIAHRRKYGNDLLSDAAHVSTEPREWRGWDWSGCRFGGRGWVPVFEEGGDFSNLDLRRADFGTGSFRWVDFDGADLRGASFTRALILESSFTGANIKGATFLEAEIDYDTVKSSGWTPVELAKVHRTGATFRSLDRLPPHLSRAVLGDGPGLTLTFDTRLHRFDPTAFDALIAQVLGPDTDVTIEERSNIDADGPAFIRINGRNPDHLAAVAEAFYDRVWRSVEAVVEERALARAMSSGMVLLLNRLDDLRSSWSGATVNHPAVATMLADQAESHALTKTAAAERIEELSARIAEECDARRALEALIAATFAPGTLHAWVAVHLGAAVADALPGPVAPHADVVSALVVLLERRGTIDGRFFSLLSETAPAAAAAVRRVEDMWANADPGSSGQGTVQP